MPANTAKAPNGDDDNAGMAFNWVVAVGVVVVVVVVVKAVLGFALLVVDDNG